jgi:ribosomal protein S21
MSWFTGWWRSVPSAKQTEPTAKEPTQVIEDTYTTIEELSSKRMQKLYKANQALKDAQSLKASGNKNGALQMMRKKQQYEKQAEMLAQQIANMETTSEALEQVHTAVQITSTLKDASSQMRDMTKQVSVDDIETVQDDLDESIRDVGDIGRALSRPLGMNEAELEEQDDAILKEMESWDETKQLEEADRVEAMLPSVVKNDSGNDGGGGGGSKVLANPV